MEAKKIKIGDIAEIKTPAGLAYVQYTHDSKDMGQIVRVLPGLYAFRPADFTELARQKGLYFIFYTLRYALRAGQTEIVSRQPVPDWAKPVPLMRHGGVAPAEGRRPIWRIVDALAPLTLEFLQRTPVTSDLTHEQRKLSIHVLRPHQVMVEELARGWTPERAEEFEEQDRAAGASSFGLHACCAHRPSLMVKSAHGIDAGGAASGDVGGQNCNCK